MIYILIFGACMACGVFGYTVGLHHGERMERDEWIRPVDAGE